MSTLYVTEQYARLEKTYHSLEVVKDDEVLLRVPLGRISEVVLVGSVGVTTPALHALLAAEIPLALLRYNGELLGRLTPPIAKNLELRRLQYQRAAEPEFALKIARQIAHGKAVNQRTLTRRLLRTRPEIDSAPLEHVKNLLEQIDLAPDLASLRGYEGSTARIHFELLRAIVGEPWGFKKRARRPPPDPVNALLSLGYSLLTQNAITALEIVGLDPFDGFYHADQYGRPALALDLLEEFRSLIVDSVVIELISREMIQADDFMPGDKGGVLLKPPALKKFLAQYTRRMQSRIQHPDAGRAISYQKCLELQARRLRKVIEGSLETYEALQTR